MKTFDNPEALNAYFSGDRIECLVCHKTFRNLGIHLKNGHGIEADVYREQHGIPWTRGLTSAASKEAYSAHAKRLIAEGIVVVSKEAALAMQGTQHRPRVAVRDEYAKRNLAAMNAGKSGEEAKRRAAALKRGSPEHREAIRKRLAGKPTGMGNWWSGKKQSAEHKAKRIAAGLATKLRKKQEAEK